MGDYLILSLFLKPSSLLLLLSSTNQFIIDHRSPMLRCNWFTKKKNIYPFSHIFRSLDVTYNKIKSLTNDLDGLEHIFQLKSIVKNKLFFFQMMSFFMLLTLFAFFCRLSDPRFGGTYMTLFNTFFYLGFIMSNTFVLKLVAVFTRSKCSNNAQNSCTSSETRNVSNCLYLLVTWNFNTFNARKKPLVNIFSIRGEGPVESFAPN